MARLSRLGTRVLIVSLGDPNPNIQAPELPEGYLVEKVTPEALLDYVDDHNGLSREFLDTAQARGDRAVANFYQAPSHYESPKQLVGYGFVTTCYAPVTDQVAVKIDANLRYRYKGWTHEKHRRKYLSHARGRLNSTLFPMEDGCRMVSYADVHNYASRLNRKDVKPTDIGWCLICRLFGRDLIYTSKPVRKVGFQLVKRTTLDHV